MAAVTPDAGQNGGPMLFDIPSFPFETPEVLGDQRAEERQTAVFFL
jgi:hypothetical protein